MNKHLIILVSIFAVSGLTLFGFISARAQTAPPNTVAPIGNVPAPINVGAVSQTKSGSFGLKNGILVIDSNTSASNPLWSMPTVADFALDTDGPIASHGIFSTADVRTDTSLYAHEFISTDPLTPQLRPICGRKSDGKIILCSDPTVGAGGLTVDIKLNKTICTGSNCDDIDISWTSSGDTCSVVSGGPQFSTGGLANGDDKDNIALQTTTYSIYCTNAAGQFGFDSEKLTVTDASRVVMQMRKIAPLPFTNWTINYANSTGSTPFNSCFRNAYTHQATNQPNPGNKETLTGSEIQILTSDNIDKGQYCEIEDGMSWTPNCANSGLSWGLRMKSTPGQSTVLTNVFGSGGTNTTCMRVKCKNNSGSWVYSNTYMHRNGAFGVTGCGPIN